MRTACATGVLLVASTAGAWAERIAPVAGDTREAASCEETWTWVSPLPQGNGLEDVAFSPSARWVAVGLGGAIVTSSDGLDWAVADVHLPPGFDLRAVTWGDGEFVAVGGRRLPDGRRRPLVATSPDGREWTVIEPPIVGAVIGELRVVAWNGSLYVAIDSGGYAWRSLDGTAWTSDAWMVGGLHGFSPSDLLWTGRDFVSVGAGWIQPTFQGGMVVTSPDGRSWTPHPQAGVRLNRATTHGDTTVAVGEFGTARRVGEGAWESGGATPSDVDLWGIAWAGDRFVAIGNSSDPLVESVVFESPDGAAWSQPTVEPELPDHPTNLAAASASGSTTLVAVGQRGQLAGRVDSGAWMRRDSALDIALEDVAWTGNRWVAVGGTGVMLSSPDGLGWQREELPLPARPIAVASGGGRVVAVGNGLAVTSTGGGPWTVHGMGLDAWLEAVAWDGVRFVAVGLVHDEGVVLASPDGETWTRLDGGELPELSDVVSVPGGYLAFQRWGPPLHSADGVNWSAMGDQFCPWVRPRAGAWNGRTLAGVGSSGAECDVTCCGCCGGGAVVSSDLVNGPCIGVWPYLSDVAWDGRRFVAVGECGSIVTSSDGTGWDTVRGFVSLDLAGVGASPDAVVVVGYQTILTRTTCPQPRPVRPRLLSRPR